MKIGIEIKKNAYVPETYAYKQFFEKKGYAVELFNAGEENNNYDICIYYPGIRTVFESERNKSVIKIHDYASLSTPPYPHVKNAIKRIINAVPSGYVYLNQIVRSGYNIKNKKPYIFRDMGVDSKIFQKKSSNSEYDVIYVGSVTNRYGLLPTIKYLSKIGLKILIVGELKKNEYKYFKNIHRVDTVGRVERSDLPQIYANAKCGLNYTPNIYPYNLQTSTKTLEYCAAGLGVLSNKNNWIIEFERKRSGHFLYIDDIVNKNVFDEFNYVVPDVGDLEWNNLFEKIGIMKFIDRLMV
jgi:hypothetical protein